jgi:hypothetical protein
LKEAENERSSLRCGRICVNSDCTSREESASFKDEPPHNLSTQCVNDTIHFVEYLKAGSPWAQNSKYPVISHSTHESSTTKFHSFPAVLDAQAKIPSGIKLGNFLWLGSYEECKAVRATDKYGQYLFRGKYCTAQLPISSVAVSALTSFQ